MILKKKILPLIISTLIFFLFGEILIRVYDSAKLQNLYLGTSTIDEELGWIPKDDITIERDIEGQGNVVYETKAYGFKAFGKTKDTTKTVFFLGDSFTQAVEINNEETYYEILKKELGFNLFAFGMSGYSTFQEKLILDQFQDEIEPNLVVLQFCTNDFIDNYYELNRECNYKINSTRPYQKLDGSIQYKNPLSSFAQVISYSKFLHFVSNQITKISQKNGYSESGESKIAHQAQDYQPFKEAVSVTRETLLDIKENLPPYAELLVFCADNYDPQLSTIRNLCQELNIPFVESHLAELQKAKAAHDNPFIADGVHWNRKGHLIVAKALKDELERFMQP